MTSAEELAYTEVLRLREESLAGRVERDVTLHKHKPH
jgi:hypothetical protein